MENALFNHGVKLEGSKKPPEPLCLLLGRDREGRWIIQESHGLFGGLFASKDAAIAYGKFESADRPSLIRLAAEPIDLDWSS